MRRQEDEFAGRQDSGGAAQHELKNKKIEALQKVEVRRTEDEENERGRGGGRQLPN